MFAKKAWGRGQWVNTTKKEKKKGNKETILISKMRSRAQHIYQWINMVKGQKYILISLEEDLVYISANLLSAVYVKHNVI